ncbi:MULTISPECIES: hypothetical protein [unclassified Crossiella]|uniref:hypothetical protein n=1 Tax=unclassified Crossiella TaxID=2620835 RepID=UPI001FFF7C57|nr:MULTISPECIES: hypothetical protein [unclassified Crossiella]MCK2243614.1 hypothetical protein [Crossiella sp. S99.2]MCK2257472.1 hypothetical protein [Crossiella sp. S99.1]
MNQVRCRAVDGTVHTLTLRPLAEVANGQSPARPLADAEHGPLPSRLVAVNGITLLHKQVPRDPAGTPGPLAALDREIRATHRFAQLFPAEAYPPELPRLRYYDVDSEDPFVLLEPARGVPAAAALPRLSAQDRHRFQAGLLRALHLAEVAGLTHGGVDLDALRWDPTTRSVQLLDFHRAAPGDIRADIWDAGLVIWRAAYPGHLGRSAPDLHANGGALRVLLDGVFTDPPTARPGPAELLNRLRESVRPKVIDLGARLAPGQHAFDLALRRKRERATAEPDQDGQIWPRLREMWRRIRTTDDELPPLVRCPVCLDRYPPPENGLWRRDPDGAYHELTVHGRDPVKGEMNLVNTYRRCPNPSGDTDEHYLPATYFTHEPPLVVAMIGRPTAGKTHLLAALVRELVEQDGLAPYGLTVVPLDLHRHDEYRTAVLEPAGRGARLPRTPKQVTGPAEILLIRGPYRTRPLVLFDVAGEDLEAVGDNESARFLIGVDAVLFVHGLEPTPERGGNQALEMSLARFQAVPELERLPAAIVATKADRLRYQPPVSHWLREENQRHTTVDPELIWRESRDVYAFLHQRQEFGALAPFGVFDRCTLHFVSATGTEAAPAEPVFPRGFAPSRVLQPLVSILAMAGVLGGERGAVGV